MVVPPLVTNSTSNAVCSPCTKTMVPTSPAFKLCSGTSLAKATVSSSENLIDRIAFLRDRR